MKLLYLCDKIGRIQYLRGQKLAHLSKTLNYDVQINIQSLDQKHISYDYDRIYFSHFSLLDKFKHYKNKFKLASITSHKCVDALETTIKYIKQFDAISVNNLHLFLIFKNHIENLYYTPNGVDTNIFSFKNRNTKHSPICLGWVGNTDRDVKNFDTIINPLEKQWNRYFDFKFIKTSKSDKDMLYSHDEMAKFYQNIDFLLIASDTEGTPNPGLEAMSCGTPVISTKVGNMTEIVKNRDNGYLVEQSIDSFNLIFNKLLNLSDPDYYNMSQKIRKDMIQWDWITKSKSWFEFFKHGL